MRVTQSMITRNYLRNMNTGLSNLSETQERMTSGSKFSKASQNVADAARALKVRQSLFDNEQYLTNITQISGRLLSAESNLSSINDILVTVNERLILKGLSDTNGAQRDELATEMDSLREQIVQFANAEFARGYLFGGTNNAEAPFSVDGDGRLLYNGIDIDSIYRDPADGLCYYDNALGDKTLVPENSEVFQDVGIGLTVSHGAAVDPRSAYRASFSGLDVLGFGKTTDGVSNNLFNLLKDASDVLRAETFDEDALKAIGDNIEKQRDILMSNIIDIGARSNFLDKTAERIEKDNDNLIALQQKIEVVDIPTETISWKTYTAVMEAIYQFGSTVLPNTLMDYLR